MTVKSGNDPATVASGRTADTKHVYRQAINGFAAKLSDEPGARSCGRMKRVAAVEPDRVVTANATQNMDANGDPWGLDRIDQRSLPLSGTYTYNTTASGVTAYVIDTGIATRHSDFGGRAQQRLRRARRQRPGLQRPRHARRRHDRRQHLRRRQGRPAARRPRARLRRLRLDLGHHHRAQLGHRQHASKPAVANMSLGGGYSASLNQAATNLANSGVFLAVAAGNESQDACNVSPASAPGTYTTAASDRSDVAAYFSNYGGCVDGYAPGVDIKSDVAERRHQHDQRHVDGQPARRGRGGALQGRQRRRRVVEHRELDQLQRHLRRDRSATRRARRTGCSTRRVCRRPRLPPPAVRGRR